MKEEVQKLREVDFNREMDYPKWVSNVVMVRKLPKKWRMCTNFMDLNKAYLKDSFPLPIIDQLVDATAGFALFSFLDAYSRYNQIGMDLTDEENTSFITDRGLYNYKVLLFGLKAILTNDLLIGCSLNTSISPSRYMWMRFLSRVSPPTSMSIASPRCLQSFYNTKCG